ncbi:MAG: NADH-quinone oxidoreductase subunit I [Lachnospiraceae bacterium]
MNAVWENVDEPDFSQCDDCGICAAHCSGGALTGSPFYVQRLVELAQKSGGKVILACENQEKEADCKLRCLASYPWEVLALLALQENQITFFKGDCETCVYKMQMIFFERNMDRLEDFLGKESYCSLFSEETAPILQNRREVFAGLLARGKRTAAALLPEELRQEADGDLWRRLLLYRLYYLKETGPENTVEAGWTTPIITDNCIACGICERVCPNGALRVVPTEDGHFLMAHFGWKCRGCGLCKETCPWQGIEGFGVAVTNYPQHPMTTLTGAHPCSKCQAPCAREDELCMTCKIQSGSK